MEQILDNLKKRLAAGVQSPAARADSLYVGGQSMADILFGQVTDSDIAPEVIEAYRLQYPDMAAEKGFVEAVRDQHHDPEAIRGLVSGVKGKLFETQYTEYLNDGHLPEGLHAELADKANQPGYDIIVKDGNGNVDRVLQAKASASLESARHAIEQNPDIDVIVPAEMGPSVEAAGLAGDVDAVPIEMEDVQGSVDGAVDQAAAASHLHIPFLGLSLLALGAVMAAHKGKPMPMKEMAGRGGKIAVASLVGQGVFMLTGTGFISIPAAMGIRMLMEPDKRLKAYEDFVESEVDWSRRWQNAYLPPEKG